MKFLKSLFTYIALILIGGGAAVLGWQYFRNKQLFIVLLNNSIVKGSIDVLQKMAMAAGAIVLGLVCLVIALKFGSAARRNEREKKAALIEQQRENEELNRQLRKEAEEARAEAEKAKTEAALYRQTLNGPDAVAEEPENKEEA